MDIRPVDLPELRNELLQFTNSRNAEWFYESRSTGSLFHGAAVEQLQAEEVAALRSADLYHLSEPMIELAFGAASSLPPFELEPEDVPSTIGFAFMGSGSVQLHPDLGPAAAVLWRPMNGMILFTFFADTENVVSDVVSSGKATRATAAWHRAVTGRLSPMALEAVIPFGTSEVYDDRHALEPMLRIIRAAWLLMQQPLVLSSEAHADRAAQKRLRRAGYEPRPVRVIELRRPAHSGSGDGSREFHHQWIVRGHWRQQWHPAREVHRPVWIAPHIKGPEGAPLIGGEKVYAWKR